MLPSSFSSLLPAIQHIRRFRRWADPAIASKVSLLLEPLKKKRLQLGRKKGEKTDTGISLEAAVAELKKQAAASHLRTAAIVLCVKFLLAKENANGVRGVLKLPIPILRDARLLVFAPPAQAKQAIAAGAIYAGGEELIQQIIDGTIEFNRCIATMEMMPVVAKAARVLGPKGLMPNVKTGTLTDDLNAAISDTLSNIPFRIDKAASRVNIPVANTSFSEEDIRKNIRAVFSQIMPYGKASRKGSSFVQKIKIVAHKLPSITISAAEFYSSRMSPLAAAHKPATQQLHE